MNRVQLIGNLGQAAELKTLSDGKSFCKFSVACNESYTDKATGEKKETTTWVNCSLWGAISTQLAPKLTKGAKVFVEGKLKVNKYTDKKDGLEKTSTEVQASIVQLLASMPKDAASPSEEE